MEQIEATQGPEAGAPQPGAAETEDTAAREWVGPGVSVRKRWLTGAGVALAAALFFFIAVSEGASMLISTLIGAVFIGCFVWYLTLVAPTPFTIRLDAAGVSRAERGGEPAMIPWGQVAKVKEELFKNGTSVSLTMYKRVGERGLHRSWVVYRDDIPRFDALRGALHDELPVGTPWIRETVHD